MPEAPHLSIRGLNKQFVLHLLDGKRLTGFADISFDVPFAPVRWVTLSGSWSVQSVCTVEEECNARPQRSTLARRSSVARQACVGLRVGDSLDNAHPAPCGARSATESDRD